MVIVVCTSCGRVQSVSFFEYSPVCEACGETDFRPPTESERRRVTDEW